MSTYYYLICEDHLERTDAASRSAGGIGGHVGDAGKTLCPFIVAHCGCPIRIVHEHEEEAYHEDYEDWTADNVEEMAKMGVERGFKD